MRRREFLRRGALAVAALVAGPDLLACSTAATPAPSASASLAAGGELQLLAGTGPLPPADLKLKDLVQRWAAQHPGWKAALEVVAPSQLVARLQAAVQANTGLDLVQLRDLMPWAWSSACADVSDVALGMQHEQGPFHEAIAQQCLVDGHWRALPFAYLPTAWIYRQDLWGRVGRPAFVDTLADLATYGALVRAGGAPLAVALDHTFSAAASWLGVLWGFGAQEVQKDGQTVAIQSAAT
ncbi:MAG TPA: ABC transporter substrate-binding protein, partial [Candidatus Acidoferrales bacterium]|nr:ABC transporter substrate-binding protein [Candidatus Acidoferrales bacterium]